MQSFVLYVLSETLQVITLSDAVLWVQQSDILSYIQP